jgi:hypothetical protein
MRSSASTAAGAGSRTRQRPSPTYGPACSKRLPDGTELAVALQPDGLNDPSAPTYLRVYSVASGAVLHSWFATARTTATAGGSALDPSPLNYIAW